MTTQTNGIIEKIANIIFSKISIGQTLDIKAKSIEANLVKNQISLLSTRKVIQDIEINFSSYCDLLLTTALTSDCNNQVILEKVFNLL
jgi:hypothetical protein